MTTHDSESTSFLYPFIESEETDAASLLDDLASSARGKATESARLQRESLDEYDEGHGGHLIPSLQAFLERNARWEAAAAELYVHRHTLRYRMRKVEELTGRDLASARDRMELFLALRARDLLASADGSDVQGPGLASPYKRNGALAPSGPRRGRRKG